VHLPAVATVIFANMFETNVKQIIATVYVHGQFIQKLRQKYNVMRSGTGLEIDEIYLQLQCCSCDLGLFYTSNFGRVECN
jgi:hypothetical protein